MSNDRSSPISVPPSSASTHHRRASWASSFSDYITRSGNQGVAPGNQTSSMANAVANAQSNGRRRLSITTLGLSGSPTQTSPFGSRNNQQGSLSSSVGSSTNVEEAVIEDNENGPPMATPHSPFARRVSFGAQALRDVRGGSIGNGRYPSPVAKAPCRTASSASSSSTYSPPGSVVASIDKIFLQNDRSNKSLRPLGEGFNWSEALRNRAERAPSMGAISPNSSHSPHATMNHHQRAASIASMEHPSRDIPRQPKQNKPDFFQEKILRGDFMD